MWPQQPCSACLLSHKATFSQGTRLRCCAGKSQRGAGVCAADAGRAVGRRGEHSRHLCGPHHPGRSSEGRAYAAPVLPGGLPDHHECSRQALRCRCCQSHHHAGVSSSHCHVLAKRLCSQTCPAHNHLSGQTRARALVRCCSSQSDPADEHRRHASMLADMNGLAQRRALSALAAMYTTILARLAPVAFMPSPPQPHASSGIGGQTC